MFGLGFTEILVICVVALLVVGPDHLPELARTLGRTFNQLKRTMDEVRREIALPTVSDLQREILSPPPLSPAASPVARPPTSLVATEQTAPAVEEPVPYASHLVGTCEEYKIMKQEVSSNPQPADPSPSSTDKGTDKLNDN